MIIPAEKYRLPEQPALYRLTLTSEAYALALSRSKPIAGFMALARKDGRWDVMVSTATADQLNQHREPGEHLTDVVVRLLKELA